MKRTPLPNGASMSPLLVYPKDWETTKSITYTWSIVYRYYDNLHPNGVQKVIKAGVNELLTAKERRLLIKIPYLRLGSCLKNRKELNKDKIIHND